MKHAWLVSRASGQSLDLCPVLPQLKQLRGLTVHLLRDRVRVRVVRVRVRVRG